VIPSSFTYKRPATLDDALRELTEAGENGKLLAGGHSLIPLMKLRFVQPETLIDIGTLKELSYIRQDGDQIAIGALTRHVDVETSDLIRSNCNLLAETAAEVGDVQVRNRGTIGGSLAHGDGNADLPAAMIALDAQLVARSANGQRIIPAREFFRDFLTTALEPTEILTEIRVPILKNARTAYVKFNRRSNDWAIVGCATIIANDTQTIAWTGVGATPVLADHDDWHTTVSQLQPIADIAGSAEYKRHLATTLAERALTKARAV